MYAVRMNSRLTRRRLHLVRVNRLNIGVAKKIRLIQRQNVVYAISLHNRGKTRIVYLNSAHIVSNHQLAPIE